MTASGDLLVVRNDRLGDAMLALPTIPVFRDMFPRSKIHFWAAPAVASIIECVCGIDRVFVGSDNGGKDISGDLKQYPIGIAYCLRPTFSNAMTLKRAAVPVRIGTSRRWYSFLFTERVNLPRRSVDLHEADQNLKLIGASGEKNTGEFPEIIVPDEVTKKVQHLLRSAGYTAKDHFIVLHPGSGGSARDWPAVHFRELAGLLSGKSGYKVIVTGSEAESDLCQMVAERNHINLAGKTSLVELAALLRMADLVVSNSTGPLHLSVALGTRVVGLYPPVPDCMPNRWGPYGHTGWALVPDRSVCSRCRPGELSACECMESLRPVTVLNKCLDVMTQKPN